MKGGSSLLSGVGWLGEVEVEISKGGRRRKRPTWRWTSSRRKRDLVILLGRRAIISETPTECLAWPHKNLEDGSPSLLHLSRRQLPLGHLVRLLSPSWLRTPLRRSPSNNNAVPADRSPRPCSSLGRRTNYPALNPARGDGRACLPSTRFLWTTDRWWNCKRIIPMRRRRGARRAGVLELGRRSRGLGMLGSAWTRLGGSGMGSRRISWICFESW